MPQHKSATWEQPLPKKTTRPPIVRIIGGQWRARKLSFRDAPGLRPSGDRVRETLFNWLQRNICGSRCLDLFAGSGALGFEAASRGAGSVVMVENNAVTARQLHENRGRLQANAVEIVQADADDYLHCAPLPFDIVFLDPPFAQQRVTNTCAHLQTQSLLTEKALVYIETPCRQAYQIPNQWSEYKSGRAGQIMMGLYLNNR